MQSRCLSAANQRSSCAFLCLPVPCAPSQHQKGNRPAAHNRSPRACLSLPPLFSPPKSKEEQISPWKVRSTTGQRKGKARRNDSRERQARCSIDPFPSSYPFFVVSPFPLRLARFLKPHHPSRAPHQRTRAPPPRILCSPQARTHARVFFFVLPLFSSSSPCPLPTPWSRPYQLATSRRHKAEATSPRGRNQHRVLFKPPWPATAYRSSSLLPGKTQTPRLQRLLPPSQASQASQVLLTSTRPVSSDPPARRCFAPLDDLALCQTPPPSEAHSPPPRSTNSLDPASGWAPSSCAPFVF